MVHTQHLPEGAGNDLLNEWLYNSFLEARAKQIVPCRNIQSCCDGRGKDYCCAELCWAWQLSCFSKRKIDDKYTVRLSLYRSYVLHIYLIRIEKVNVYRLFPVLRVICWPMLFISCVIMIIMIVTVLYCGLVVTIKQIKPVEMLISYVVSLHLNSFFSLRRFFF